MSTDGSADVSTDQVTFGSDELLESHRFAEPLVAGGVRCHGGFDGDGNYVSPRTAKRVPAIAAWQAKHRRDFGTEPLDLPLDTWPQHYPNVAQGRFLIESGVPGPIIATLTRIGTVEGFGGLIRHSVIPDLNRVIDEDIRGTALAHLGSGLFEAHARDEAGFEDEGGHEHMWFAARDLAFENPLTDDMHQIMLERMGIVPAGGTADPAARRAAMAAERLWPDDVDVDLEVMIARMVRLLLIEISAFHGFAWAEALLSDPDLVAGDGEAARLVSYIRADETPHVDYLRTALSELRDRTVVGEGGRRHAGADLVGGLWDRALAQSLGANRRANLDATWSEVSHAVGDRPDAADLLVRFDELGAVHRRDDGTWVEAAAGASAASAYPGGVDDVPGGDLTVTVLGCSGTYAGPGGACSGYLVRSPEATVAVDLGSGTLANLQDHVDLAELDAVVLSHEHPDHWLDVPLLRNALRYMLDLGDLPVYGTAGTRSLAAELIDQLEPTLIWHTVDRHSVVEIGDLRLRFSRTDHPVETLAVRVDAAGRSLLYSADTGPAWRGDGVAGNVHTFLCEASFTPGAEGRHQHLSARQAAELAGQVGAERLVLTHLAPGVDPRHQVEIASALHIGPVTAAELGASFPA